ncbi:MAG TPA: hypothetical protein IAA51_11365 [Candidatus Cottocaccamicrobium excrementipullorum]|nr:hypothetical protein [Candidatus Cottocaccamicrobium excrementipullorum]
MNQDYVEWLVKRKDPAYAWPVRILMGILCAAALVMALVVVWGPILLLIAGAATFFVFQMLSVEYEYLYVDGSLSVDKILGKARRKKVLECSKEELLMIAPSDSYVLKDYETSGMKVVNCSSQKPEAKTFTMIYQKNGQHYKVILEPNDKLLQAIRYTTPRKIVM